MGTGNENFQKGAVENFEKIVWRCRNENASSVVIKKNNTCNEESSKWKDFNLEERAENPLGEIIVIREDDIEEWEGGE